MANQSTEPNYSAGTITEIAQMLYEELLTSGSSLMLNEIIDLLIKDTKKYIGWAGGLHIHAKQDEQVSEITGLTDLNVTDLTQLSIDEWVIIDPVVRAHCEVLQAGRMEGAQSLGLAPSGLSKAEADMTYREALEQMKKEAFQCEPFSIGFTDIDTGKRSATSRIEIGYWQT